MLAKRSLLGIIRAIILYGTDDGGIIQCTILISRKNNVTNFNYYECSQIKLLDITKK